jgi:lipoate-protein ligase A
VERDTGTAAALLEPWPPAGDQDGPVVRAGRVSGRPALVIGSTQRRAVVDEEAVASAGIDVLRRTTGGGAVLVARDAQVWLDLWVPRRHPLWNDDVVRSALWLGDAWVVALEGLGAGVLDVHRGPVTPRPWSDLVCFAGLGPGEVHVVGSSSPVSAVPGRGPAGAKVMGLAQRRTRSGARFHTTAPLRWDPAPFLTLLDMGHGGSSLQGVAVGLRTVLPTGEADGPDAEVIAAVENAVIAALP